MRHLRIIAFLTSFVLLLTPPAASARDDPPRVLVTQVDNSHYPDVVVYVSVTNAAGDVLPGISQAEFAITEDGAPVQITAFGGGGQVALSSVLVIDCSGSMNDENKIEGARQAALTFVDLMRSQDQAALIAFSNAVSTEEPLTSDTNRLKDVVNRLVADGETAWYDALYRAVDLTRSAKGRRSIILLTDSLDNQSAHSLNEAIEYASGEGVPVYAIGLGAQLDNRLFEESLRVAQETGGAFYHAPSAAELKASYESLVTGMQQEYVITYRSPRPTFDGTRRNIVVTVSGTSGGSVYLEQHLLNVRSDVLAGTLCLLPLLVALLVPAIVRRRRAYAPAMATEADGFSPAPLPVPAPWQPPVNPRPIPLPPTQRVDTSPVSAKTCLNCKRPIRPEAKFCQACGADQTQCPQCRRPLRRGARFCNQCGFRLLDTLVTSVPRKTIQIGSEPAHHPKPALLEAYAIAQITDLPDSDRFLVDARYHLQAGIRQEMPYIVQELGFGITQVALPPSREIFIDVIVRAEDMDIEPSWIQQFTFRPDLESNLLEFELTPRKSGHKKINVEFLYERHWLGQVEFEMEVVELRSPIFV